MLIVGGGLASARAIKSYREAGGEGSVGLVSKDSTLPYHRPPLSKKFLRGETDDEPLVEDEAFYADYGVEVMLETAVSSVTWPGPHRPGDQWPTTSWASRPLGPSTTSNSTG